MIRELPTSQIQKSSLDCRPRCCTHLCGSMLVCRMSPTAVPHSGARGRNRSRCTSQPQPRPGSPTRQPVRVQLTFDFLISDLSCFMRVGPTWVHPCRLDSIPRQLVTCLPVPLCAQLRALYNTSTWLNPTVPTPACWRTGVYVIALDDRDRTARCRSTYVIVGDAWHHGP